MVQSLKKADTVFLIIAGLYLLVSLYRLQDIPPPWYDEIVHLNTAGHLAEEGRMRCDFYAPKFKGVMFNGMPLNWILLGAYIKLFGLTLAGARFFYVLLSVFTLFGIYGVAKKLFDEDAALYSVLLLASCYIFFHNSRQVMAQVPAALFSVMAILAFYTARDKSSKAIFALSGFFSALAYISHPTGLGIFFIITVLSLYKKIRPKLFFLYLAGVFFTTLPYIVYVAANFQEYVRQTGFILKGLYPHQNIFLTVLDEIPVRYFGLPPIKCIFLKKIVDGKIYSEYLYSLKWCATYLDLRAYFCEIMSKAPFILSLAYLGLKKIKTESQKDLLLITVLYVLLMSFHPNKFGPYVYMVAPFLSICLAVSCRDLAGRDGASKRYMIKRAAGMLLLAAFLSSNYILIYKELTSKKIGSYEYFIKEVSGYVPKGSTVAAPVYFWLGMRKDYNFVSANQIIYEIDEVLRNERSGIKFERLSTAEQDGVIKKIFERYKIQYALLTCHYWGDVTEVPAFAARSGNALRRFLFYNADKEKDYLRLYYYGRLPEAARFENEVYEAPAGSGGFYNVSEEYRKSLKIYRIK